MTNLEAWLLRLTVKLANQHYHQRKILSEQVLVCSLIERGSLGKDQELWTVIIVPEAGVRNWREVAGRWAFDGSSATAAIKAAYLYYSQKVTPSATTP